VICSTGVAEGNGLRTSALASEIEVVMSRGEA
jgi:hypothetical protein